MQRIIILLFIINVLNYSQINFSDYFEDKALRIDYIHTGDKTGDSYSLDELIEEKYYGGSKKNLIDPFNYGKYKVEIFDSASQKIIFAKHFATLFSEWQTTEEAKHVRKSFSESVQIPYPKNTIGVKFYSRDRKNILHEKFSFYVNPKNYFIKEENRLSFPSFEVLKNGDPQSKVDIVIIPEGYAKDEIDLFKRDCEKFSGYLFNASPFKENKNKFNIWAVEAPSIESGTDIPAKNLWKKTLLNSSFYTFDSERYLMTADNKSVRDLAANAPYDQIYILVNTSKYGGGSIYNHYSVCVSNNNASEYVFVHEFGHGFASLADEYYESGTSYQDFYPLDIEPLEANLTTLVNFDSKWKNLVDASTPIPTPKTSEYEDKVGAFEGGGYVDKNIYRPKFDCSMKSISVDNFCPVCKNAIIEVIEFFAD